MSCELGYTKFGFTEKAVKGIIEDLETQNGRLFLEDEKEAIAKDLRDGPKMKHTDTYLITTGRIDGKCWVELTPLPCNGIIVLDYNGLERLIRDLKRAADTMEDGEKRHEETLGEGIVYSDPTELYWPPFYQRQHSFAEDGLITVLIASLTSIITVILLGILVGLQSLP